ncbi:MAG: branched-chain amino acid ABC transporter permease [Actinomycetota bacterium]
MALFLQFVVAGLASGFVVALLALSVVVVYRSTRVLSFAQGAIASLSTYVFYQLSTVWGWTPWISLPLALIAAAVIGALAEIAAMRPLRKADALTRTVATLGLVLVLQVIMRTIWGGSETFVRRLSDRTLGAGNFSISGQELILAVAAISATALLISWNNRAYTGLGLAAMAEDPTAARLLGVDPSRASTLAWSIAAVLAALAGILVTPLLVLNPFQMTLIMVTSFGAALLGGFTSVPLAVAGALLIGVTQSVMTGYVNVSGVSEAFGFIAVFLVLMLTRGRRGSPIAGREASAW